MEGLGYIKQLKNKWKALKWLEASIYALGISLFAWMVFDLNSLRVLSVLIGVFAFVSTLLKPWKIDLLHAAKLIDGQLDIAESSAVLLVKMEADSSMLYQLQQLKVGKLLAGFKGSIKIPNQLLRASFISVLFVGLGSLVQNGKDEALIKAEIDDPKTIEFTPVDTAAVEFEIASIENIAVHITPPAYTGLINTKTSNPNLNLMEGTLIRWEIKMSSAVESLIIKSGGIEKPFETISGEDYGGTWQAKSSGFYNFEYISNGQRMVSEIYKIEVTKDAFPEIEVVGLEHHTRFNYWDAKRVDFTSLISDDFGIMAADIIATVAKGSGESVKFREEKLAFDNSFNPGKRTIELNKSIDLDSMGLTPGDELYFYVQVSDNKTPEANVNRTATYFLSITDTTSVEFSLEGSLGVDLMPDYFRSQRQLIIETEQLVKDRSALAKDDFNFKSNELGFDQKALRLRYGQFMGEEFESGIMLEDAEGNVIEEAEDPLAAYVEEHDTENEANLVDETAKQKAMLEDYIDAHEDDEEATFFTVSIKQKLREAMTVMWDSELHLRLFEPEKSLPYQYQALELLKQIKNHARVYVHRIGFDPPPIKEEVRLSGDLDELESQTVQTDKTDLDKFENIKLSIARMTSLIEDLALPSSKDKTLFEAAGVELAALAMESPREHLSTLQYLKNLSFDDLPEDEIQLVLYLTYQGLVKALPDEVSQPRLNNARMTALRKAYLKQFSQINND